jgi:hypothetical protein
MEERKFPPAIMLTQLRQKVSRAGVPYLEGRLGLSKCLVLQANKKDEDGNPLWNLLVQEIPRDEEAKQTATRSGIFAPAAYAIPMAAKAKASPEKPADEIEAFPFDDNIDDLFPGGRA